MRPVLQAGIPTVALFLAVLVAISIHSTKELRPSVGFSVELARKSCGDDPYRSVVLTPKNDGRVLINYDESDLKHLPSQLRDIYSTRAEKAILIAGEPDLRYARLIEVIDIVKGVDREWHALPQTSRVPVFEPPELRSVPAAGMVQGIRVMLLTPGVTDAACPGPLLMPAKRARRD